MKEYYKNGQRVLIGGVPCKVAKWVTKDMLAVMRESSLLSQQLAREQVLRSRSSAAA